MLIHMDTMKIDKKQQFVEEMGLYLEQTGLPRMAGRIVGWLLICHPPEQTQPDLVEALQASKSSISTALRTLLQYNLVQRAIIPGERRDYYRIAPDLWVQSWQARMSYLAALRQLSEKGLQALDEAEAPESQRRRLEQMRDLHGFLEVEFPKLLEKWEREKQEKGYDE
jgi:DNA-binding transcriptional regulator GbsR (MarR family)